MKTIIFASIIAAGLSLSAFTAARADESDSSVCYKTGKINFWVGSGQMEGGLTYRIGSHVTEPTGSYDVIFPISQLEWQLSKIPVTTAGAGVFLFKKLEVSARASWSGREATGVLKDTDWTIPGVPQNLLGGLVGVYSESDSTVKVFEGDASACYWFEDKTPGFNFDEPFHYGLAVGYLYQSFNWDASNVDQWYPYFPDVPHVKVAGLVGTYDAVLNVPYAAIEGKAQFGNFSVTGTVGYSPLAVVEDRDDHILRSILATTRNEGYAVKGGIQARYDFMKHFFLGLRGDFLALYAEGKENDIVYAGTDEGQTWTIDHKVEATNYTVSADLGFKF